ncbi:VanZ family protein [Halalkalibacter alkaliphilus]|uniref:VanZ family protein n=1 Tax=Halalkalibacter alkaliphilus TaxID=2917993 RepID=A0A9X2I766_9BACI|nr:VanZ family protein [Halalkalibacter alkaliphilus]MCL7749033.1 VanZ family protein [Halalkalibacter alkaliphilus]
MKKWLKIVVFYWLPVLFVAAMIFTASSQPYEQQDIRPYISQATDLEKMKEMYNQLKVEHVQHRLYVEENGFKRTLQVIVDRWKVLVFIIGIATALAFVTIVTYVIKAVRKHGYKQVGKASGFVAILIAISGVLAFLGMLFAFRIEELLIIMKNQLTNGRAQSILEGIRFQYAGNEISVERLGFESFIEFLIRKGAHFGFFFLLGFLTYRALWASGCMKKLSYFGSLLFVLLYAISDEIHQAFTPNRTPLVQDVILDFSGGLTGVTLAFILYMVISVNKKKAESQKPLQIKSRMDRRKFKG